MTDFSTKGAEASSCIILFRNICGASTTVCVHSIQGSCLYSGCREEQVLTIQTKPTETLCLICFLYNEIECSYLLTITRITN